MLRREEIMESGDGTVVHSQFASHHHPSHRHVARPIDTSYRLVVRTVLWVVAGLVFLGIAVWWILT